MLKLIRENKLAAVLLLIGFVCSIVLCAGRINLEAQNGLVCIVMTEADAQRLGFTPGMVRTFDGSETLDGSVLLVEDENQYSHIPLEQTEYAPGNSARCFKLTEKYAARYAYLGYLGAEEIENILFRAVTDRNIRVLWLTPFVHSKTGEVITDSAVYSQVIENLSARISAHGLTLTSGSFTLFPDYAPNELLLVGVGLGVLGALLLVLSSLFSSRKLVAALFLLCCAVIAALMFVVSPRVGAVSLAAACVFPCLSVVCFVGRLSQTKDGPLGKKLSDFLSCLLPAFLISLFGGLFVAALQSSEDYLLAVYNFRGVKVSQLVPLGFALVLLCLRYYGSSGIKDILSAKKGLIVLLIAVLAALVAVFLLRTGDGVLSVGVLEQRFRNLLEETLIARPRTKEFLIAWPCLALACLLAAHGTRRYVWPFALISTIGFSSVVNTFCHSRAPVWLSSVRSALGLVIGLALGLVLICIADLFPKKKE